MIVRALIIPLLFTAAAPAMASTPEAWSAAQKDAIAACLSTADLKGASVRGDPLVLDDSAGKTAVLVRGRWKPAHMNNAHATMLCLYDRASKAAAVTEANGWSAR